ncbi:hypothetical protein [Pontibacter chitinilyticus]
MQAFAEIFLGKIISYTCALSCVGGARLRLRFGNNSSEQEDEDE